MKYIYKCYTKYNQIIRYGCHIFDPSSDTFAKAINHTNSVHFEQTHIVVGAETKLTWRGVAWLWPPHRRRRHHWAVCFGTRFRPLLRLSRIDGWICVCLCEARNRRNARGGWLQIYLELLFASRICMPPILIRTAIWVICSTCRRWNLFQYSKSKRLSKYVFLRFQCQMEYSHEMMSHDHIYSKSFTNMFPWILIFYLIYFIYHQFVNEFF